MIDWNDCDLPEIYELKNYNKYPQKIKIKRLSVDFTLRYPQATKISAGSRKPISVLISIMRVI